MKTLSYFISLLALATVLTGCEKKPIQPPYEKGTATTQVGKALMEKTDIIGCLYTDEQKTITDGLTYTFVHFLGKDGAPMRIWFLKAETAKAGISFDQTWAGEAFQSEMEPLSKIIGRIDTENNYVWAAINSDFGSDAQRGPQGIFHHNGICYKNTFNVLSTNPDRPRCFWYMTPDGKIDMADQADYSAIAGTKQIVEASAGGPLLIDHGAIINIPEQSDGLTDRHPRTALGVEKDGTTVWMMIADGRRYTWSNGLQYPAMCTIMQAVGCYNMMNLDGGGSSEMILKSVDPSKKYEIVNWTNDNGGTERNLATALYIATKK